MGLALKLFLAFADRGFQYWMEAMRLPAVPGTGSQKIRLADGTDVYGYRYDFTDDTRASGGECIHLCRLSDRRHCRGAAATVGCVAGGILFSLLLYRFFQKNRSSYYMSELLKGLKASSCGLILSAAGTIILLTFFGSSPAGYGNPGGCRLAEYFPFPGGFTAA